MESAISTAVAHAPWNKGKLVGQKAPLKLKEIWAIRVRLQLASRVRELAMFNLAIDSKLRACDLVKLRVNDVCHGDRVSPRAIVMQQKTQRPVQFEITESTRDAVPAWIAKAALRSSDFLFPSRIHESPHLSTRQYAGIVGSWVRQIGLDQSAYGTHTMRRTKPTLIYRRTKNVRAIQLLLDTLNLKALFDTSASRLTMRWRWRNRQKYEIPRLDIDRARSVSSPNGTVRVLLPGLLRHRRMRGPSATAAHEKAPAIARE